LPFVGDVECATTKLACVGWTSACGLCRRSKPQRCFGPQAASGSAANTVLFVSSLEMARIVCRGLDAWRPQSRGASGVLKAWARKPACRKVGPHSQLAWCLQRTGARRSAGSARISTMTPARRLPWGALALRGVGGGWRERAKRSHCLILRLMPPKRAQVLRSPEDWDKAEVARATVDEDGHYCFAVALWCAARHALQSGKSAIACDPALYCTARSPQLRRRQEGPITLPEWTCRSIQGSMWWVRSRHSDRSDHPSPDGPLGLPAQRRPCAAVL